MNDLTSASSENALHEDDRGTTPAEAICAEASLRICPFTGWSVLRKPEWTRVVFEEGFSITAEIIGGCILLTHNRGRATLVGVRKAFEFTQAIIADHFSEGPYVHILDYTHLAGTSLDGRRFFIRHMTKRRQLAGVIFYGLSPMLRMSTQLGKRLHIVPFNVHIAKDYRTALALAPTLLKEAGGSHRDATAPEGVFPGRYQSRDGLNHPVLRSDDWQFERDGLGIRIEVIGGHIIHAIAEGSLQISHLTDIINLRERVYGALAAPQGPLYFIIGLQGLQRVDRLARKAYQDSLRTWHRKVPIQGYIVYGLNPFTTAVINFSRYILPFPIQLAEDLDQALAMTRAEIPAGDGGDSMRPRRASASPSQPGDTSEAVEPLLEFIGNIDWEKDGISFARTDDEDSPLGPVYDAIKVIKSEMDDLLSEKVNAEKAIESARDGLESRVRERTAELIDINRRLQSEIHERREMESALRASEKNYRDLVDSVNSIILRWDARGRIVFMNPYGLKFFGYAMDELLGKNVVGTIVPESESISQRDLDKLMRQIQQDPDRFRNNENENITRDGRRVWIYWTNRAIMDDDGRIVEILSVGNDITGRRHMEAELRRLATTDPLTGAFNRRRFFQKARQEFLRHQRYNHCFAVLLMDMDHFKKINDTHGHPVGDAVLKAFVETCQNVFRVTDIFGRTGGEEFSAVLPETDITDALQVAERLRYHVANNRIPVETDGRPITSTVSIGLTSLHEDDVTLESMIRRADKALYAAKRAGRNCVKQG